MNASNDTTDIEPSNSPQQQNQETNSKRRNFEQCNESLFINIEESRQTLRKISKLASSISSNANEDDDENNKITQQLSQELYKLQHITCQKVRIDLEELQSHLKIAQEGSLENIMIENSQQKTMDLLIQIITFIENNSEDSSIPTSFVIDDGSMDFQACVAQLFEMALDVVSTTAVVDDRERYKERIAEMYNNYQLKLLRGRCKPYIAELVHHRKEGPTKENNIHVQTITQILSEGSTLIHPLLQWNNVIQNNEFLLYMINTTIDKLKNEICLFVNKIFKWFDVDCRIGTYWLDVAQKNQMRSKDYADGNVAVTDDLEELLEHIAFLCQVLSRYNQLVYNDTTTTSEIQLLTSELSGQYATLENYYISQSFRKAIVSYNHPIEINNQRVYVPSIIEDTFYLCKRSIHRSFETLDLQAMITICHVCVSMWNCNVEEDEFSLVFAILSCHFDDNLIQVEKEGSNGIPASAPSSQRSDGGSIPLGTSSFAAALLGAIDNEDSNIQGNLSMQEQPPSIRVKKSMYSYDTISSQICILNGLANASSACIAMSDLLLQKSSNTIITSDNKIFQFNMDELSSYSRDYKHKLKTHCDLLLEKYCYHRYPQLPNKNVYFLSRMHMYFYNQIYDLSQEEFMIQEHAFYDDVITSIRDNILVRIISNSNVGEDQALTSFDTTVSFQLLDSIVDRAIDIFLSNIIFYHSPSNKEEGNTNDTLQDNHPERKISFNDWGVILLSKQIRYLTDLFTDIIFSIQEAIVSTSTIHTTSKPEQSTIITGKEILSKFEKLNVIITILQLEKPNDWISLGYYKEIVILDDDTTDKKRGGGVAFTRQEIYNIMKLKKEFLDDAIRKACFY